MPPMSFQGIVTKVGVMNKTATVTVTRKVIHKPTLKTLDRVKKFLVHDENNCLRLNDKVVIRNCPPISARKRFKLETVLLSPEAERANKAAAVTTTGSAAAPVGNAAASIGAAPS